jgi:trk system potassium uptake protein TrkA
MKQFAIIGLGTFGKRMAEEFTQLGIEFLVIDKDRESVERYKHVAAAAYCVDALNPEAINRTVPATIDGAIVDLGKQMETSILTVNYLKKIGVQQIVVKAENDEHAEILRIVGADRIVFPEKEAAQKITPSLLSSTILNLLPAGQGLVIAEIRVPDSMIGRTIREVDVRRKYGVNVVGVRHEGDGEYELTSVDYRFQPLDILLIAGQQEQVASFSGIAGSAKKKTIRNLLRRLQIA